MKLRMSSILLLAILSAADATATSAYHWQLQTQTGATAGPAGVLFQNLLFAPGKSSWSDTGGYFLDVFDITAAPSAGPLRRLKLDQPVREISLSGDLLLLKYPHHVELLRLSAQGERSLGVVMLKPVKDFAYQATIYNNQLALRRTLSAGPTEIEIYQVDERISLKKTLEYHSAGNFRPLTLDNSYVYIVDRAACDACASHIVHRIRIDNNEVHSIPTNYKISLPEHAGNGYFYALDPDAPFRVNIVKFDTDKLTPLYTMPIELTKILRADDSRLLYTSADQRQLCQTTLTDSGPTAAECQDAPQHEQRKTAYYGDQRYGYATPNQLILLNKGQPPSMRPWLRQPALSQFGWLNGQLLVSSDKGYFWQDPANNSLSEATGIAAAATLGESRTPLFFSADQLMSYRRQQGLQLFWQVHRAQQDQFTQTGGQQLMMSEAYNAAGAVYGQHYFANFAQHLEVFKHDGGNSNVVARIPASALQTADGVALQPFASYEQQAFHLDNILFKPAAPHLLYLSMQAAGEKVLQRIPDVQRFASDDDKLLVAFDNQLRQYQWQTQQYVQTGAITTAACAPGAKPTSLSISNKKAIVVMHWQSSLVPQRRNFLCIYNLSSNPIQFETQLELPTAATGDSLFKFNGNELYGVVGNDGRLFRYRQNFAPTFPSSVTVKEDSQTMPLVALNDVENDTLTLQITKAATQGSAGIFGNQISYSPKTNYHGPDTIGVKVTDTAGNVTEQDVAVTVVPVNDHPVAEALQFSVTQNEKYNGQLQASDVDGDKLSFSALTQPKLGTLLLNAEGSFSYQPTQSGDDSFTVTVSDGNGGQHQTQVSVKVNASTSTGGTSAQPTKTDGSAGGSNSLISLLWLSGLVWCRRLRQ
mgnify:CR=1 FL=1